MRGITKSVQAGLSRAAQRIMQAHFQALQFCKNSLEVALDFLPERNFKGMLGMAVKLLGAKAVCLAPKAVRSAPRTMVSDSCCS
jgi:hypothetical protein